MSSLKQHHSRDWYFLSIIDIICGFLQLPTPGQPQSQPSGGIPPISSTGSMPPASSAPYPSGPSAPYPAAPPPYSSAPSGPGIGFDGLSGK